MEYCDVCGATLQGPCDVDARQEWKTETFHCDDCDLTFTKRTDFHLQTNIPAKIYMERDWHESDVDKTIKVLYDYEYNEAGIETTGPQPEDEPITHEEIKDLILNRGLELDKVIDAVIEINGFIGVGLITLGDSLKEYVHNKIK